jgi:hypothetical protein
MALAIMPVKAGTLPPGFHIASDAELKQIRREHERYLRWHRAHDMALAIMPVKAATDDCKDSSESLVLRQGCHSDWSKQAKWFYAGAVRLDDVLATCQKLGLERPGRECIKALRQAGCTSPEGCDLNDAMISYMENECQNEPAGHLHGNIYCDGLGGQLKYPRPARTEKAMRLRAACGTEAWTRWGNWCREGKLATRYSGRAMDRTMASVPECSEKGGWKDCPTLGNSYWFDAVDKACKSDACENALGGRNADY